MLNSDELEEFKWDVQDYIKYGEENGINQQWMKELENASAKVHISRLEALKLQTQQELEKLYGNYHDSIDEHITNLYTSGYYHTAFEVQRGMGVGWQMQNFNSEKVSDIIHKPWAVDGRNFSDRVWMDKTRLINSMHDSLTRMCITGESPDRAIQEISKNMKVSRSQAARIVQTESAAFSAKAQESCFSDLGVEEFQVVETLDSNTCDTCGEMDGKHFQMKDYKIGVTVPPFHPNCRAVHALILMMNLTVWANVLPVARMERPTMCRQIRRLRSGKNRLLMVMRTLCQTVSNHDMERKRSGNM